MLKEGHTETMANDEHSDDSRQKEPEVEIGEAK